MSKEWVTTIFIFGIGLSCLATNAYAENEVTKIADPTLSAIANLRIAPDGTQAIVYNPILCDKAGPEICGFYLAHEQAHIVLHHATNKVPAEESEPEADCWAAKTIPKDWAVAAYNWFMNGAPSPPVHGSSALRAQRIKTCGGF